MARLRRRPSAPGAADGRALEHPEFVAWWARSLRRYVWRRSGAEWAFLEQEIHRAGEDDAAVAEICEAWLRDNERMERCGRQLAANLRAAVGFGSDHAKPWLLREPWRVAAAAALTERFPPLSDLGRGIDPAMQSERAGVDGPLHPRVPRRGSLTSSPTTQEDS